MERQSPFADELFWKRAVGLGLVLGGAAAAVVTLGLGLLLAPDPARL